MRTRLTELLWRIVLRFGTSIIFGMVRVHCNFHHSVADDAIAKAESAKHFFANEVIRKFLSFDCRDRFMQVRVEFVSGRRDRLNTQFRKGGIELLVDHLDAFKEVAKLRTLLIR